MPCIYHEKSTRILGAIDKQFKSRSSSASGVQAEQINRDFVVCRYIYDGSFTMANSNSFLSPYEILPIAQENKENKYLRKFSYFIVTLYVVCTHENRLIQSLCRKSKRFP